MLFVNITPSRPGGDRYSSARKFERDFVGEQLCGKRIIVCCVCCVCVYVKYKQVPRNKGHVWAGK